MKVLLTEGSGLTSRQVADRLAHLGHQVGLMTSDPLCLSRFTRSTRHRHRCPAFGTDPFGWFDAAVEAYEAGGYDVVFPTQEQVTVLAARAESLDRRGVRTAVPSFDAVAAVQDKVSAFETLKRLGLPQPAATVVRSVEELAGWTSFPCFAKVPIGTASGGVQRAVGPRDLMEIARAPGFAAALRGQGIVVQAAADGGLLMVQTVFDHGRLVAAHANERVREGARGGASHKRSNPSPEVIRAVAELGEALRWHGALSADVIATPTGPLLIDINPRLVEPGNARRSGVDLVGALLDVCVGTNPGQIPTGNADVRTHQLLLAVLGAAQRGAGRRAITTELRDAACHRGDYLRSEEELTPIARDPLAAVPVAAAALATLAWPPAWAAIAGSSVSSYALTPEGWDQIRCSRSGHPRHP